MAKQVTLAGGRTFATLSAAKAHFDAMREATSPGAKLTEPDRSDILDIYQRYCAATNWQAVDAVDVTTKLDNRQRPHGGYATTKAFAVVTTSGATEIFSIDKALAAIAE
ncbi:hypothetical protein QZM43_32525 [Burkholderia orbicola]|uniref:hypothetical protein n=1 Tax=Burkholderia orbicola TaxID=2978683 RepID=UPI002652EC69|nr:hypothetical protein [Burkholderia orbicola]MDN7472600.1 hypothetical protein [Burkholderia orbicola]MDN7507470.1 hypothetical protein [Burkholderia orbicola]